MHASGVPHEHACIHSRADAALPCLGVLKPEPQPAKWFTCQSPTPSWHYPVRSALPGPAPHHVADLCVIANRGGGRQSEQGGSIGVRCCSSCWDHSSSSRREAAKSQLCAESHSERCMPETGVESNVQAGAGRQTGRQADHDT